MDANALNESASQRLDTAIRRMVLERPIPMRLAEAIARAPLVPQSKLGSPRPRGSQLSPARQNVLALICCGLTNAEIAEELGRSKQTIQTQVRELLRIVGAHNRTHLAVLAVAHGLVRIRSTAEGGTE
jgi:DNA-binding NarL/FixJ family response regulator